MNLDNKMDLVKTISKISNYVLGLQKEITTFIIEEGYGGIWDKTRYPKITKIIEKEVKDNE